jgi:hypothetical protein
MSGGDYLLPLPKTVTRRIIQEDGHLVLKGNESVTELREALGYLLDHECPNPPGIPASVSLSKHYALAFSRSS